MYSLLTLSQYIFFSSPLLLSFVLALVFLRILRQYITLSQLLCEIKHAISTDFLPHLPRPSAAGCSCWEQEKTSWHSLRVFSNVFHKVSISFWNLSSLETFYSDLGYIEYMVRYFYTLADNSQNMNWKMAYMAKWNS